MYLEDLISTFQNIAGENYPELKSDKFLNKLRTNLEKKKFDLQDQTIIENILKSDLESFSESFSELLESAIPEGEDRALFFKNDNGEQEVIDIYIKSVEHSIDYFYNDIISKQFSGK